jgi:formate dehydrogenase iron-sulfur subunit
VMYVLHHADRPSLYSGLPDDPRISPLVGLWKGMLKPISLAAIAFAGVFGFLHYITKGPNEVSETDERKAEEVAEGKQS